MKNDQDIPLQKCFGLRVKELRDGKGMTQEDLADGADLFRTYISRIETGLANPSLTVIHALAKALAEPVASLLSPPTQLNVPAKTFTRNSIARGRVSR
ncbi:helix-turn-helix transcriptional regulator [Rhodoferax sp.]|uniref:helix-turn-helix domain-containing protein n=1 Tax=Rhodoferax sp. TaxID=50421 RepID=UPI0026387B2B|nr:helix-turn-helix transcriptional regulator [Rhodoferax sp.]MDD5480589.1 helix-turn-helix transcriptional regulator [Rhodoferax sp.]